ncbi:hypothetical protein Ancab_038661, partial [Ancistrocladus abbreviatus]
PKPSTHERSLTQSQLKDVKVEDVNNQGKATIPFMVVGFLRDFGENAGFHFFYSMELNLRIKKYSNADEEALPSILETTLARKLLGKHEETDDKLVDELQFKPPDNVNHREFESDFEDAHEN